MKKLISLLLMLTLLAGLTSLSVSAADAALLKNPDSAAKGDLLFVIDFSNTSGAFVPQANANAKNYTYTVGDNGRSITVKGGTMDKTPGYWGAPIDGLAVDADDTITMTYKVKSNGTAGKNNSIGVGGWLIDTFNVENCKYYNNYSNYNSQFPAGDSSANRSALSMSSQKYNANYTNGIDAATPDADGFISCMIEFDAPKNQFRAYAKVNGEWTLLEEQTMAENNNAGTADNIGFVIYSYYQVVDTTVKDVKFFKGVDLTDAQLNAEPSAAQTPSAGQSDPAPSAPQTADHLSAGLLLLSGALVCAVCGKKRIR